MIKKKVIIFYLALVLILLIPSYFIFFRDKFIRCNDGTEHNECSKIQPYLCLDGTLIESPSICECAYTLVLNSSGACVNDYKINPKKITFNYTLNGKKGEINFTSYQGIYDYLSNLPRYINAKENLTLFDFKSKSVNEERQKALLLPLVIEIQNLAEDKDDQARIAISLVQNIPFGSSNKFFKIGSLDFEYYRYPYEVIYENQGVCGEKSALLAFLLKELGYGSAFLYYPKENHEAMGIKCPSEKGIDGAGYCFIETTGPSIITDNKTEYISSGKLDSTPEIIPISYGESFGEKNFYEYKDAAVLDKIRERERKYGTINFIQNMQFQSLKKRYGLISYEYTF